MSLSSMLPSPGISYFFKFHSDQELWNILFTTELPTDLLHSCKQEWGSRDTPCLCPGWIRTGWFEQNEKPCCNICGKEQTDQSL